VSEIELHLWLTVAFIAIICLTWRLRKLEKRIQKLEKGMVDTYGKIDQLDG
jgi:hypothetical protein